MDIFKLLDEIIIYDDADEYGDERLALIKAILDFIDSIDGGENISEDEYNSHSKLITKAALLVFEL